MDAGVLFINTLVLDGILIAGSNSSMLIQFPACVLPLSLSLSFGQQVRTAGRLCNIDSITDAYSQYFVK